MRPTPGPFPARAPSSLFGRHILDSRTDAGQETRAPAKPQKSGCQTSVRVRTPQPKRPRTPLSCPRRKRRPPKRSAGCSINGARVRSDEMETPRKPFPFRCGTFDGTATDRYVMIEKSRAQENATPLVLRQ